jgi:hypothetical protein
MSKLKLIVGMLLCAATMRAGAQEPPWNANAIKPCDRACLVGIIDGYLNAIIAHNPKAVPPVSIDVRMTENTGQMEIGEGVLWRSKVEETPFKIYIADPVSGQVALHGRVKVQGRDNLIAIRLKVDRGKIAEVEQLWASGIAPQAIELLKTPSKVLTEDVQPAQRVSREVMARVANSYFDALEGDSGKIGAFADDCVRHENGYQTVNNPLPGGRMMPGPHLPNPDTPQGKEQLRFSMLTCSQQIDSKIFAYTKHIRPRRADILDEQKQIVASFPLFVHDGTRRGAPADAPPGMLQNLVTMETFSVRGGMIHHVEAAPFVTIPYGLGNGWTAGSGR